MNSFLDFEPVSVSMDEYNEASEAYIGWCPHCSDFTRDCTEPDAEEYDCPICENHDVVGAEQAVILGLIEPNFDYLD